MIRQLLPFALMLGVAAVVGANEARAVAVLGPVRTVAQTTPDPSFAPVGFKRHGSHRALGGHRGHASRSFAGRPLRPGVSVMKRLAGPRLFSGKHLRPGTSAVGRGLIGPGFLLGARFGSAGVVVRNGFVGPRRFVGRSFGAGGVVVRNGFVGPRRFVGEGFGDGGVIVRSGFARTQLFLGKGFGHRPFSPGRHLDRAHR